MDKTNQKGNAEPASIDAAAKPQGVLVLGMHRSGTSACTRVLNLLGCSLADNLLGAGEGNESGHWEPIEVVALNDRMLESAGSSYDDWGPVNPDWRNSKIRAQMVSRAREIVADHIRIGPLFAIKDPRICRLADVWLEAVTDAGGDPLVLLMLRNPIEVSSSLEARDLMADGYAELVWLRHVLDAEFLSRGQKRIVCRYDELMSNWQALVGKITKGLEISFPRNSPKVHAEISQFLMQNLRHYKFDNTTVVENPSYSHWLRTTFKVMLDWSEHGENVTDHVVLDEIRTELDRSYGIFASLLLKSELSGAAGSGAQLRGELLRLQDEAAHAQFLQVEIERLGAELAELTSQLADVHSALHASQANVEAELGRSERAAARLIETSLEVQDQQLRNAELAGQSSALKSALVQRQEELAQFLDELKESERARGASEAELERKRQQCDNLEQEKDSLQSRVDALAADFQKVASLLEQKEDESRKLSDEILERAAETNHFAERVGELSSAVDKAETARFASEQKLAACFGELAQLTTIVAKEAELANASQLNADWLSKVRRLEEGFPAWWTLMPQAWQARRKHGRYRGAGLFDGEAYLALYPDVDAAAMDPIRHYILHGMSEGRVRTSPA